MALVSLQDITLHFGGPPVLDNATLHLEAGERVGLVGRNGAGKSSLMLLINGELQPQAGTVARQRDLRTARLPQESPPELNGTIRQVVAAGLPARLPDGPPPHQRVDSILSRMLLDGEQCVSTLSGGMVRRVLLARALVADPDVLLLDEPTNHLDIDAIVWMEELLERWRGALVFVTHDRMFLQRLARRIVEIDRGAIYSYSGDYGKFLQRRDQRLQAEEQAADAFDDKLAAEEAWIRQGIMARRTRNEGRVRTLQAMRQQRRQRRSRQGTAGIAIQEAERSGDLVIEARNVSFAYDDVPVIQGFSTLIARGDRLGVVGANGSGKTTLLRLLLGQLKPDSGSIRHGTRLHVVHFDQLREQLDPRSTVAESIAGGQEYLNIDGRRKHVYGYLQDFLFTPDRARTPVSVLSGGERNRLLLARTFSRPANLMVLDEPTNDLDVETLELLEERLMQYSGTLLLVSHDRTFLDNVVTALLVLDGRGGVQEYTGGYSEYHQQRVRETQASMTAPTRLSGRLKPGRADSAGTAWSADAAEQQGQAGKGGSRQAADEPRRQRRPRKLSFNERRELEALPERIEELEKELSALRTLLADPVFYQTGDKAVITATQARLSAAETELESAYARWEELAALEE